jgi:hypothetical protein
MLGDNIISIRKQRDIKNRKNPDFYSGGMLKFTKSNN